MDPQIGLEILENLASGDVVHPIFIGMGNRAPPTASAPSSLSRLGSGPAQQTSWRRRKRKKPWW